MSAFVADIVIVGGGTAGCILASQLASKQTGARILLLEGGSDTRSAPRPISERRSAAMNPETDYGYSSTPQSHLNDRVIPYARGKGLGGTSLTNYTVWTVGSADDYDHWGRLVGDDSWKWENVKPRFEQIVRLHDDAPRGIPSRLLSPIKWPVGQGSIDVSWPYAWVDAATPLQETVASIGIPWNANMNSGDPLGIGTAWSSSDHYTRSTSAAAFLKDSPPANLTIWTNSPVSKILLDGKHATGVQLSDGRSVTARKEVIICGGAINTPHLLMLSGIGPAEALRSAGIEPLHDLPGVGQNLGDHAMAYLSVTLSKDFVREHVADKIEKPEGIDPFLILMGFMKSAALLETEEFKALPRATQEYIQKPTIPNYEFVVAPVENPTSTDTLSLVINIQAMTPQSKGEITLNPADPTLAPNIDLQLGAHPYDQRVLREAARKAFALLDHPSLKPYIRNTISLPNSESDADITSFLRKEITTSWHVNGSVQMGPRSSPPALACVDPDFRVYGIQGLRVADLSICPFTPNNHTQSSAYMIGYLAAERVSSQYSGA